MLSRETTRILAEVLHYRFKGSYRVNTPRGSKSLYKLYVDSLYDFLYDNDYDAWFLNAAKNLNKFSDRALKEFVMRLHTGETLAEATPDWSWEQRRNLGQRLLLDLAEDILVWAETPDAYITSSVKKLLPSLQSKLELDGYIFRDGKLYYTEAAVFDAEAEQGILSKLIRELELDNRDVMEHHLELSATHFVDEKWEDSIGNSRKFLESVLQEIAAKHHLRTAGNAIPGDKYSSPGKVRYYLKEAGLVEPREKQAIDRVYALLSHTGSHPYIAERDQARLMRHLALTFSQFALLRLRGFIDST